ncbi:MAG: hypothetical protein SWH61_02230 [Thermodesulfobacteriota bacterium]|nr:hypothetical protein [Thermodesulfobacteriota bacterium]
MAGAGDVAGKSSIVPESEHITDVDARRSLARARAFQGDYDAAIDMYQRLCEENAADPGLVTEMARTAAWAGRMEMALSFYGILLTPPVDRRLLEHLVPLVDGKAGGVLQQHMDILRKRVAKGSIWQEFADIQESRDRITASLDTNRARRFETIMASLHPVFMIQRKAGLERDAKQDAWEGRLLHARNEYAALLRLDPTNQEAAFDAGQVECRLGLCDLAADRYAAMIARGQDHSLVRRALTKMRVRHHPGLTSRYAYWRETGYGDLAGMRRHHYGLGGDVPVLCRMNIAVVAEQWREKGDFDDTAASASGGTVSFNGPINAWLDAAASWTLKDYSDDALDDKHLGRAEIRVNGYDYIQLGVGFSRENLPANTFALRRGIETDTWWLSASADPARRVNLAATLRRIDYSDDNKGVFHDMTLAYRFSDHPRTLKVMLTGVYRHTENDNRYVYAGNRLMTIIHPYWAPKDYTAGSVVVQWRHALSAPHFCGNDQHYYDIRIGGGSDSDSNPGGHVAATWHYEFNTRWTVELNGFLHLSEEWDATGLDGRLAFRF